MKKYGTQAQAVVTTYNLGGGNQDVAKFDAAYKAAYTVGKELGSLSYVMNSPATAYLTSEQKELAYDAGVDAAGIDAEYQRAYDMGRSLQTLDEVMANDSLKHLSDALVVLKCIGALIISSPSAVREVRRPVCSSTLISTFLPLFLTAGIATSVISDFVLPP